MRVLLGCAAVLILSCTATSMQDKKDETIDAKKLVGKWQPNDKKTPLTIEFAADGKLTMTIGEAGKDIKMEGTYKLDGRKLDVQLKFMGEDIKEKLTIKKLTDDELVTEDSKGKEEKLNRKK